MVNFTSLPSIMLVDIIMFYIDAVEKDWQHIITQFEVEFETLFVEYIIDLSDS